MVMFYALVALCFSSGALAQIAGSGPCPKVETMPDFNIREMPGRWYLSRRYFSLGEMNLKCVTSDLLYDDEHGVIQMNMTAVSLITGKIVSNNGTKIRVADPTDPGKLETQSPSSTVWEKHWILGSEYDNYVIGYNCVDLKMMNLKYLWIWTRQQQPSKTVINNAVKVIEKQNLNPKWLLTVDQTNCGAVASSDESEGDEDAEDWHMLY